MSNDEIVKTSEKIIKSLGHGGMYLMGKSQGLENAEFYLRHIHPTNNEHEKDILRAAADAIRERKMVAQQERQELLSKQVA